MGRLIRPWARFCLKVEVPLNDSPKWRLIRLCLSNTAARPVTIRPKTDRGPIMDRGGGAVAEDVATACTPLSGMADGAISTIGVNWTVPAFVAVSVRPMAGPLVAEGMIEGNSSVSPFAALRKLQLAHESGSAERNHPIGRGDGRDAPYNTSTPFSKPTTRHELGL